MVDNKSLEDVRKYLAKHKADIIDNYEAEGVGIGKMESQDDAYVIVVYLNDRQAVPQQVIEMDGITLKFEVTGKFVLHT